MPRIWPVPVSSESAFICLARPKSVTFGCPFAIEQHVGGFEVAVDNSLPMRVFDRLGHLFHQLGCLARWQGTADNLLRQALAFNEGHREIMLTVVLADFEDRDDPRMVEFGRRLGLGIEPFDVTVVGKLPGQNHFQSHDPVEVYLPGLENDSHAATGDFVQQLVVAEVANGHAGI